MGNPIPTKIKFKHYVKAIKVIAYRKYKKVIITSGDGSSRRFDIFLRESDTVPTKMWTAHEDAKLKVVWTGDLKKACVALGIDKKEFQEVTDSF